MKKLKDGDLKLRTTKRESITVIGFTVPRRHWWRVTLWKRVLCLPHPYIKAYLAFENRSYCLLISLSCFLSGFYISPLIIIRISFTWLAVRLQYIMVSWRVSQKNVFYSDSRGRSERNWRSVSKQNLHKSSTYLGIIEKEVSVIN